MAESSLKANYALNVVYQVLTMITPLVTAPYLSRVLGAGGIGEFSYTYSIANYFVLFAMLGISNHGCRSVAMARKNGEVREAFWGIYPIQIVSSLLACLVYALCFVANPESSGVLMVIWGLVVASSAFDINWLFFGLERFKVTVVRNVAIKLSTLLLIFAVVRTEADLWAYALLYAASIVLTQLALWPFALKEILPVRISLSRVSTNLAPCLKLFIPLIAISFYTSFDTIVVGALCDMTQVGFFDYASRFAGITFLLVNALGTVMLPRMSSLSDNDPKRAKYVFAGMGLAMTISGAFAFGLVGVSHNLAVVFLGEEFEGCQWPLVVMCLSAPFIAWANVIRTQCLIPLKMDESYIGSIVVGALLNILTIGIFARLWGALGAAMSYTLSQTVICVIQTKASRRVLPLLGLLKETLPFAAIGIVMAAVVSAIGGLLGESAIALITEIAAGIVFYATAWVLYIVISRNQTGLAIWGVLVSMLPGAIAARLNRLKRKGA